MSIHLDRVNYICTEEESELFLHIILVT